jgi:hypothetical protein
MVLIFTFVIILTGLSFQKFVHHLQLELWQNNFVAFAIDMINLRIDSRSKDRWGLEFRV